MGVPDLEPHCGSWIVVSKASGQPVLETFSRDVAECVNQGAYRVVTAMQWLGEFNARAGEPQPLT